MLDRDVVIVGVDVSSKRVDLAWLEDGKPCRWHQELAKGHLIDRLRSIRIEWPRIYTYDAHGATGIEQDTTEIAIEYPFGRGNAIAALMATTGIITRQAPPWARVAWPSSGELRAAIGAKNNKASAHEAIVAWSCNQPFDARVTGSLMLEWNEHEIDALTACIGWTRILEAQDACTP